MKEVATSNWLVSENKKGDAKFWQIAVVTPDDEKFYTTTRWYQITSTGEKSVVQESEPYYAEPTNVGRANYRNSMEQAYFEMWSAVKLKQDKGFDDGTGTKVTKPLPMLAHKFVDHPKKVTYPCYVQPKLNGMRMLFDGSDGWSRGNKEIIPAVIAHLQFENAEGIIFDGELILPGNVPLQETISAAKKFRPGKSDNLVYYVYDVVDPSLSFAERYAILQSTTFPANVIVTPTVECRDEADVYMYHKHFTTQKFEGTMIRSQTGKYEINKRSYSLLKLKDFVDEEFKVIGVTEGGGKDAGLAIFICETTDGIKSFNCRPEGSEDNRRELFRNRDRYIGKFLTVRYQELSNDNVPIFPVGVCIRDEEDFK